jgi:hypothetical protein
MLDPFIPKNSGDIIYASEWNDLQVRIREQIAGHDHTGDALGPRIGRDGIEPGAIDGSLIDPAAAVTVQDVTVTGALKVDGTAMLGDIDDLLAHVKGLAAGKVDRSGDTISGSLQIGETLSVAGQIRAGEGAGSQDPNVVLHGRNASDVLGVLEAPSNAYWVADCENLGSGLIMRQGGTNKASVYWSVPHQSFAIAESGSRRLAIRNGNVGINTTAPGARLHIIHTEQDYNGNCLILGPTSGSNLRMGYHQDYSWIQSHGTKPLVINAIVNNVGIRTTNPRGTLDVNGSIFQRGRQLHADHVLAPDHPLETIEEHAAFMWAHRRLTAMPASERDEDGQDIIEHGSRMRGMLEELEKAHIYIARLNDMIKSQDKRIADLTAKQEGDTR